MAQVIGITAAPTTLLEDQDTLTTLTLAATNAYYTFEGNISSSIIFG